MSMQTLETRTTESHRHARAEQPLQPLVDVFANAEEVLVVVDLPGVDKEGLAVRVEECVESLAKRDELARDVRIERPRSNERFTLREQSDRNRARRWRHE